VGATVAAAAEGESGEAEDSVAAEVRDLGVAGSVCKARHSHVNQSDTFREITTGSTNQCERRGHTE
jgi:hypothetical protein